MLSPKENIGIRKRAIIERNSIHVRLVRGETPDRREPVSCFIHGKTVSGKPVVYLGEEPMNTYQRLEKLREDNPIHEFGDLVRGTSVLPRETAKRSIENAIRFALTVLTSTAAKGVKENNDYPLKDGMALLNTGWKGIWIEVDNLENLKIE